MTKTILIVFLIMIFMVSSIGFKQAYAGGSGGTPLISDEVGWGLVVVTAAFFFYFIWVSRQPKDEIIKNQIKKTNFEINEKDVNLYTVSKGVALIKW